MQEKEAKKLKIEVEGNVICYDLPLWKIPSIRITVYGVNSGEVEQERLVGINIVDGQIAML